MTTPFPFVSGAVLTAAQLNAITTLPVNAQTANYTLVVGDVGKRVQMTNAGSTTITVNTGIFAAGDTIWIQNLGGTCTITAGTATVGTASSLALAQYGGGTLVFQSASAATFFSQQSASYGVATGGTSSSITVSGASYTMLEFLTDANLVVSKAGLFDFFALGGGGSSSAANHSVSSQNSGGGAGGDVIQTTLFLDAATYAIDIGAGAAIAVARAFDTTVGTVLIASGGGSGGSTNADGTAGVNGGGAGNNNKTGGFTSAPNLGYAGGNGAADGAGGGAGGGAGAAGVGSAGTGSLGGAPGAGVSPSTFSGGTKTTTVGGGGGGARGSGSGGTGVDGGGSGASTSNGNGTAGAANRGGGAGGVNGTGTAAAGGSGLCYVRFKV